MTETAEVAINGRWPLRLPLHRAARPEWPWFEAARLSAIHSIVEPGTVLFDIGSECGDFAGLCSLWGARVVMAEPNPRAWPNARLIFEANRLPDPLAMFAGFVSDDCRPSIIDPYLLDSGEWPVCASWDVVGDFGQYALEEQPGPEATLDEIVSRLHVRPDVVSLDVEGAELHVLRGASGTLSHDDRPDLFVSIHPELAAARYGYGNLVETIRWLLCEYGYPHGGHTHLATDHEQHWWFRP